MKNKIPSFDLERMKKSLESPVYEMPPGLTREEKRKHILAIANKLKRDNK